MDTYNFKKYEGQGPSSDNRISINRSGEITFPSVFCYENKVYSYGFAVLFWDAEKKVIGVRFVKNKDTTGSYKLNRSSKGGGARISVKAFLKDCGIDPTVSFGRYEWKKYKDIEMGSLFVFELDK